MPFCLHCGARQKDPDARVCSKCGKPLTPSPRPESQRGDGGEVPPPGTILGAPPPPPPADEQPPPPGTVLEGLGEVQLIVRYPGGVKQAYPVTRFPTTIGRAPDNDIVIAFTTVSRHHARLERHDGGYQIVDLESTNGIWVAGQRVQEHVLSDGDLIRIPDELGNSVALIFRDTSRPLPAVVAPEVAHVDLRDRPRVTIGRDPASDVHLDYPTVSWHHARIDADDVVADGGHTIADLGSTNGTFVDGQRVQREQLSPGAEVRIGPFKLLYDGTSLQVLTLSRQVRLDGLHLTRVVPGPKIILRDVSISIHPGDFVALVGGSGAGKSTLMNALSGFVPATEGQVLINGEDFTLVYDAYRSMIGYVPQDDIIHLGLPVDSALRYVAKLRLPPDTTEDEIERRIDEVLAAVDLTAQKKQMINSLSGGQRKRVSIAVELLADPTLLFLDEPTSGLDPGLEKQMMGLLQRLADEGRTVLLITHATANIDLADYAGFMADGYLSFYGSPHEARQFFQAQDFADIYEKLAEPVDQESGPAAPELEPYFQEIQQETPEARVTAGQLWEAHFKGSPYYQQNIESRLPEATQPAAPAVAAPSEAPRVSSLRQFWLLTSRYLELIRRDYMSLFILLAVMPLIGGLVLIIISQEDLVGKSKAAIDEALAGSGVQTYVAFGDAQTLLMMIALATVLLGVFGAAYEIIKEAPIYKRERMVNLRILPYVFSKVGVLLGFGFIQCLTLLGVVALKAYLPTAGVFLWAPLEMYITLVLAVLAAIWLGLFISAVMPVRDMVIYVVLLVLFLQILFAGAIFDLPETAKPLSWTTITYWALDALGSTADMTRLDDLGETKVEFSEENPVTGEEETREVRESLSTESDIDYSHTAQHLLSRWAILAGFSLITGIATCVAMKRKDRRSGSSVGLGGAIMKRKWLVIGAVVLLVVVAGGTYVVWSGVGIGTFAAPAPAGTSAAVAAEAEVVPVQWAALAFKASGQVVSVAVREGDAVTAGQELARLDDAELRYAVEKAKANLSSAEADLAKLKEGAQPGDIAAAQADLDAAKAELARVRRGATKEEIAVAEAKVKQAEVEVARAESNYERVKPWGGPALTEAAHNLNAAHASLAIAKAELERVKAPPTAEAIAAAQAQVNRAQAALDKLKAGATPGEIAVAQAHVNAAQVSLRQAEAALSDAVLVAPFAGSVARLETRAGEMASPGVAVIWLADLSAWQVETTDLTELAVADIRVGDPATVTFDAIPGLRLPGKVTHVQAFGKKKKDDIVYTVVVTPDQHDKRLRWNMTATVIFSGQ